MTVTVRDVMTTRVVAVRKSASFKEMTGMLRRSRISAFPVLDDAGRVVGVVSAGDLLVKEAVQAQGTSLIAALRHVHEDEKAAGITAADLMTSPAVTIRPDAPVEQAARLMYDKRVKRLPVVHAGGMLVGIVSRVDVLSVYDRADAEIAAEVSRQVLPGVARRSPHGLRVEVRDGIVTLSGQAQDEREARDVTDAIRHVQGVVAVRDRLDLAENR